MHQRTTIRNALLSLLTGTTDAGTNVFAERTKLVPTSKLPAINFTFGEETAQARDIRSSVYIRKFPVNIQVMVESTSSVHDAADDICEQIEDIINADRSLTGTASACNYLGTTPEISSEGEKPLAVFTLNYEINYLK